MGPMRLLPAPPVGRALVTRLRPAAALLRVGLLGGPGDLKAPLGFVRHAEQRTLVAHDFMHDVSSVNRDTNTIQK
jgi:hypothetical protein